MSKEESKNSVRETIDKAVDVFVDLIWEEAKPAANLHQKNSNIAIDLHKKDLRPATDLLTLILQSALDPSYCFESDFFTNLGKAKPYTISLFFSNEMMFPIIRALASIELSSKREEVVKKLAEQIYDRIEKIWLENNLTFHELIRLIESNADIANVAKLGINSGGKNFTIGVCNYYANYKVHENANATKFEILYWAFDGIPDILTGHTFCDVLDEHCSKIS